VKNVLNSMTIHPLRPAPVQAESKSFPAIPCVLLTCVSNPSRVLEEAGKAPALIDLNHEFTHINTLSMFFSHLQATAAAMYKQCTKTPGILNAAKQLHSFETVCVIASIRTFVRFGSIA
jgi:hypothetical protein